MPSKNQHRSLKNPYWTETVQEIYVMEHMTSLRHATKKWEKYWKN